MRLYLTPRAYEFACKSEICAPPNAKGTGGTGGSLKSTDGRNRNRAPHSKGQTGRPLPPPRGLAPPKAQGGRAPHSKGEGKQFPAPTGPDRSKEHKQKANDAAEVERQKKYEIDKKAQLAKIDELNKPMREKYLAKVAAEEAAKAPTKGGTKPVKPEDAVPDVEGYRAELKKREEDLRAAVARKAAAKKEEEEKAKSPEAVAKRAAAAADKHLKERAAARARART